MAGRAAAERSSTGERRPATDVVEPIATYSQQATQIIRRAILDGRFGPGQRLNEVELSASLGISRSPIREALRKLVDEGLVLLRPGRGASVASFDADELRDLVELRMAIDVLGARLAAERATPDEIAKMLKSLESTTAAHLRGGSAPPWSSDFHLLILEASRNRKLRERGGEIHTQLHLARFRSGATQRRAREAHDEHLSIVEAIRAGDPERAAAAMEEHLRRAAEHIIHLADEPD